MKCGFWMIWIQILGGGECLPKISDDDDVSWVNHDGSDSELSIDRDDPYLGGFVDSRTST